MVAVLQGRFRALILGGLRLVSHRLGGIEDLGSEEEMMGLLLMSTNVQSCGDEAPALLNTRKGGGASATAPERWERCSWLDNRCICFS